MLSLAACPNALFMDDELNVLPTSLHSRAQQSSADCVQRCQRARREKP